MPSDRIIIVGAGDFGLEVADWLALCNANVAGFIDDIKSANELLPYPLLGTIIDYQPKPEHKLLLAIADPKTRKRIAQTLYERQSYFTTMGCQVTAAKSASWGEGTICCPHSLISAKAKVGPHCHLNVSASVGHHVTLGAYSTVSSHADICGHAEIGECVFIGSHAVILPEVKIGNNAVIGAGAIVTRDVMDGETVYANSAKRL